jgi:acetylglutamate kinase
MNIQQSSKTSMRPIIVVKCGGSILANGSELSVLIDGIANLKAFGFAIVVVHGGGPDINRLCDALNIKNQFINGLRVTSQEVLAAAQMALLGKTNNNLVHKLNLAGIRAIGLSGHDDSLLNAHFIDQANLGYVGKISNVNTMLLLDLLNMGLTPVIAPLGVDDVGNTYNVNADIVAGIISAVIFADKLILLSDVIGFYRNFSDKNSLVSSITSDEINKLLLKQEVEGGMIPKLTACADAVNAGVKSAHIISGADHNWVSIINDYQSNIGTTVIKSG